MFSTRPRNRGVLSDGLALLFLLCVPLLWFSPVIFGPATLLPADNIYAFEPWQSFSAQVGVATPHNELLSDLLLENMVWKGFIRDALAQREIPLWNPYLFSGVPFLAAGQHSALYPFSLLFYLLPLSRAYGWFTALQLALAAINAYVLARVLGRSRVAGVVCGITYACSAFYITSVVFSMIIAAAAWLPLLLALIEKIMRKQATKGHEPFSPVPYVVAGAFVLGIQVLAGHIEITYYTLLVMAFYAVWRLLALRQYLRAWRPAWAIAGWLAVMVSLGLALAAVQLWPLLELVSRSFREGSVDYGQVVGWAWPLRQAVTFLIPDFFGNPSQHGYWDLWQQTWQTARNSLGQPVNTIFWGVKNYVEGANYTGILPLLLVVISLSTLRLRRRFAPATEALDPQRPSALFYVILALLSLAFAFGTPLYALLFYGLPGYRQLHSAFRWVLPLTLSIAVLAAYGLDALRGAQGRRFQTRIGAVAALAGLAVVALVALSLVWPGPFAGFGERILAGSDLARGAFADGRAFWSYQAPNLLKLGSALFAAGLVVFVSRRPWGKVALWRDVPRWSVLAVVVVLVDLWLAGGRFNPAVDPRLLDFTPPAVTFLQGEASRDLGRVTTFESAATTKTLNANLAWRYGLQDVRGYDSIIPRQYVAYMQAIEPQGQLLYNRVSPFYDPASLDDPRTDLLGVRWVMSEVPLEVPGWTLIYDREVRIYRNDHAFPRAFVAAEARVMPVDQILAQMPEFDLHQTVLLDDPAALQGLSPAPGQSATAAVSSYQDNEVLIDVNLQGPGWLVLTDAYFPGWKAYARPFGGSEQEEQPLVIYRADGNFRAVYLPAAGAWTVRFKYAPRSFQLGLYTSFLAVVTLGLLLGWWAWGRFYQESSSEQEVRRVAKNSLLPMATALLNKGIDFAFAMVRLRILSPAGEGSYTFAIGFYVIFEILVRFGLGTLLTREVARDRTQSNRYLVNITALRGALWLLSLPLLGGVLAIYDRFGSLTRDEALAIGLFSLALLFASLADGISSVFNAYEQMEYPAGSASAIALAKVALGALVLLPPLEWGFVGLAGVSVVMNLVQVVWLYLLMRAKLDLPPLTREDLNRGLQRRMMATSTPLMLNHLLAHVFFRLDVYILRPMAGAAAVGFYGAAYKYVDGLNVIPSYFTLAIFPLMSRYAQPDSGQEGRATLQRSFSVALRLLLMVSLPLAVLITFIATPLIAVLGGDQYLPGSATALQLLIWSIPIGFTNSVTQYVLIAVDQQRFLTRAFVIAVTFNIVANVLFIPRYSFYAAAVITVLSEIALFIPFMISVYRHVGPPPWRQIIWQPLVSSLAMALTLAACVRWGVPWTVQVPVGSVVYAAVLLGLGTFNDPDMIVVRRALPFTRLRARLKLMWQARPGRRT